ncbi:carbonic anhydrase [Bradyrhizobium sp. 41S5]|uniref:carbonic anhydrase n=1 Tax=Bradyrhizobium sp. 41S5 TaxID=1404443 RepID=UPI00156BA338|nr:carbonic anhydrase [Bradyrhizobium sp. 41S5]UFX49000.1 carbonic anhydrase [Bradyrhizobium sp. 41S5]
MCDACANAAIGRRGLVRGGLALAAISVMGSTFLPRPAQAQPVRAADAPDAALKLLVDGNARYVANQPHERDFSANRANTAIGQAPFAAILGCADSRVAPELAFDQRPGDLFVVRIAGNFVTSEGLGSLEFGSAVLGTKLIMVLGHTECGAVKATVEALEKGNHLPGHIAGLVTAMKPGIEAVVKKGDANLTEQATVANVRYNVEHLKKASPILAGLIAKNELRIVGGVYDLATGKVSLV